MEKTKDNKIFHAKKILSRIAPSLLLLAMISHQLCIWLNKDVVYSFYIAYVAGLVLASYFVLSAVDGFKVSKLKFGADCFGALSSLCLGMLWFDTFYVRVFAVELICFLGILVAIVAELIHNKSKDTRVALTICGSVMLVFYGLMIWRFVLLAAGKTFNTNLWDGFAFVFAAISMFVIPLLGHNGDIESLKRNEKMYGGTIAVSLGVFNLLIFDQKSAMDGAFLEAGWYYAKWFVIVAFTLFVVSTILAAINCCKYKRIKTPIRFADFILACIGSIIALLFAILITIYLVGLGN